MRRVPTLKVGDFDLAGRPFDTSKSPSLSRFACQELLLAPEAGKTPQRRESRLVKSKLWMAIATLLLNSCLLAWALGYSVNTPRRHPQLCLGKTLTYNLMGIGQCLESRNLLAGNRLHLGAWHGFQEVFFASPRRVRTNRLRCFLEDGAYVNIILNRHHKGFSAIRVSRDKNRPNLDFQALPSGQIMRKWPLPLPAPGPGWNRLGVERSGPRWVVTLGDQQCGLEAGEEMPGIVGLRGGRKDAIVDDLEVRAEDGQVLRETFDSRASFPRHLLCSRPCCWFLT